MFQRHPRAGRSARVAPWWRASALASACLALLVGSPAPAADTGAGARPAASRGGVRLGASGTASADSRTVIWHVTGTEDEELPVQVDALPGALQDAERFVASLPRHGTLLQRDGEPIVAIGTRIEDPLGVVRYRPEANLCGSDVDRFGIRQVSTTLPATQAVGTVSIDLAPVNDAPLASFTQPPMFEDRPVLLKLTGTDVEDDAADLVVHLTIGPSPSFISFFQVQPDGSRGAPMASGSIVEHPEGLVYAVPQQNYHGNAGNFVFKVADSAGQWSDWKFVYLAIFAVNDAPVTWDLNPWGTDAMSTIPVSLSGYDIDMAGDSIVLPGEMPHVPAYEFVIDTLPTRGDLYVVSMGEEILVTVPGTHLPFEVAQDSLLYVPHEPFVPDPQYDTFDFHLTDGLLDSEAATWTLKISHQNLPPVITPSTMVLHIDEDSEGGDVTFEAVNTEDPSGPVNLSVAGLPSVGSCYVKTALWDVFTQWVLVTSPGYKIFGAPPVVRYVPAPDHNTAGQPPVQYVVMGKDTDFQTASATVTIDVVIRAINDAPFVVGPGVALASISLPGGVVTNAVIDGLVAIDDSGDQPIMLHVEATNALEVHLNDSSGLLDIQSPTPTSLTILGTTDQLNAALAAGIQYVPAGLGVGSVSITIDDLGAGTAPDEPPVALTGTFTVTVVTTP